VIKRPLHITIFHLLPKKDSAKGHTSGEVIIEGLIVAVLLHALFNLLLFYTPGGKSLAFLTVPILLGAGSWYFYRFAK
jgi:hypothetical protein